MIFAHVGEIGYRLAVVLDACSLEGGFHLRPTAGRPPDRREDRSHPEEHHNALDRVACQGGHCRITNPRRAA